MTRRSPRELKIRTELAVDNQIQKYRFSGHLTPKPPGTERAMCQLSGNVYLANEAEWVEQQMAARHSAERASYERRLHEAANLIRSLKAQVNALKQERRALKRAART
jgi:hypothetical protein